MAHSVHELAEDIRRQVKKHREKRRKRSRDPPRPVGRACARPHAHLSPSTANRYP